MSKLHETPVECERCGRCCRNIWIALSPAELQTRYARWLSGEGDRNSDIHLIYPMLKFKSKTRKKLVQRITAPEIVEVTMYNYRCVHVKYLRTEGKWVCTIHAHRPWMCREYPFYGNEIISGSLELHEGCVYCNVDIADKKTVLRLESTT